MQQTIDSISQITAQAKSHVERYSERLIHLLSFVPDDKLTWTPSPTAKSSLRIVAHCALTNQFFARVITDTMPDNMPSPEEFFKDLHEAEQKITTRESAVALLKETTAELSAAICAVNAGSIDSTPRSVFGPMPMPFWLQIGGEHEAGHAGQMEYQQTIWGDMDNHYS